MLNQNLKLSDKIFTDNIEQKATRDGFGDGLLLLGEENSDVVALSADVAKSTRCDKFAEKFPERFFQIGIAEQNLAGVAAGLGVSGIVIAFAVQKVASDLFSSLSIYFDKPFKSGDFVAIGTDKGTIKSIGMRTTRLTNLTGEELVIPNSEIVSVRIQNFGNMERRRVAFNIGVTYNTPKIKLEAIPEMIKNIIKKQKKATYDRCYFKDFGDFSLGFDIVYYVETNEYEDYLKIQQAINLAIVEHFEKEKIEIAFPTQTVHVVK